MVKFNINIDSDDIVFIILVFFAFVILGIFTYNVSKIDKEEKCVQYYENHNGYILDSCEVYLDKLENIERD